MTWLAPWALAAGAMGMLGVTVAHLLSRQRPRALSLATARFLPDGMLEATTVRPIPTDRWWMLLRLLIIALLSLGVAQPVLTGNQVPTRTVLLLDRLLPLELQREALATLGASDAVVAFDSAASVSSAAGTAPRRASGSSLSAALGGLVRSRDSLLQGAEQLRVVAASAFDVRSIDQVAGAIRASIPDAIDVLPLHVVADSATPRGRVTTFADGDDAIAAGMSLLGDSLAPRGTILQRRARLTATDSAAARAGATVVWWPSRAAAGAPSLQALTVGRATWIAPMRRDSSVNPSTGAQPLGWWADGAAAVWRTGLGEGCVLTVAAALPVAGDHTLSLRAQRWMASLVSQCSIPPLVPAPAPEWLRPASKQAGLIADRSPRTSTAAPWLVLGALAFAVLEVTLRRVRNA